MKKLLSFAIYAMAALAMALAMGSCKKNDQNTKFINNNQAVSHFDPRHITDINAYLGDFKQKMKQSQYAKDGETLPLEEAAWHLSSVANYDFANANVEFTDLRYDTLYYQVNVTNGEVALSDINAVYADMADDIDEYYQNLDLEEKHFRFIGASITEDGQVMANMIVSYVYPDHLWYFDDEFQLALACNEWFDDNTQYVWNTTAAHQLSRACNFYEGKNYFMGGYPPERIYYAFTREVEINHGDYSDPYGSPFHGNSRLFSEEAEVWAVPTLTSDMMCYALDSYLELPFRYAQYQANMAEERPVHWKVVSYRYNNNKWYVYCHKLKVKFGIHVNNGSPIQY